MGTTILEYGLTGWGGQYTNGMWCDLLGGQYNSGILGDWSGQFTIRMWSHRLGWAVQY